MKRILLSSIDERIDQNKKESNRLIRQTIKNSGRKKKSRTRTIGEQEALTQIAIAKWNKAEKEGKIKRLGERIFYYDYR